MSRKLLWSFGIFLLVVIISALIITWPKEETRCVDNDGFCSAGCNFETDSDCASAETIASAESYRFCRMDSECLLVKPICGSTECPPTAKSCEASCSCALGINQAYEKLWEKEISCRNKKECPPCPGLGNYSVGCVSGRCREVMMSGNPI